MTLSACSSGDKTWLDRTDHYILAALVSPAAFVHHSEAFSNSRGIAKEYFEATPCLVFFLRLQLLKELFRCRLAFNV